MNIIDLLFGDKMPREFSDKRVFVKDKRTFYGLVNRYNGIINCFSLIYQIPEYKKYSRATIDKLYFDFDIKDSMIVNKFHEYLMKEDLKHILLFTGGGFAVYVFTEIINLNYPKDAIENAQRKLMEFAEIDIKYLDSHVIGDVSRIARIPYTMNVKYLPEKRLCIPLVEKDLIRGYDYIVELSENYESDLVDASNYLYGNKLLDLRKYDYKKTIRTELMDIDAEKINLENGDVILDMLPPFVRYLLLKEDRVINQERYWVVLAMRDVGIPKSVAIQTFTKYLGNKGKIRIGGRFIPDSYHAIVDEKIFYYIYDIEDSRYFFPNWETLENMGYNITKEDKKFELYKKNSM